MSAGRAYGKSGNGSSDVAGLSARGRMMMVWLHVRPRMACCWRCIV